MQASDPGTGVFLNILKIFKEHFFYRTPLGDCFSSEFRCKQSLLWLGQDIPNTHEKIRKRQSFTEWCRCGKHGVMDTDVEYLSCSEVHVIERVLSLIEYEIRW